MNQYYHFEGPEKKLQITFAPKTSSNKTDYNLLHLPLDTIQNLLKLANCTILSHTKSEHIHAYLLSESSLFIYPHKLVLKTCGTTTLLLVLPKVFQIAKDLNADVKHIEYGHLRYKFPDEQVYPHTSFEQERQYLEKLCGGYVQDKVLGATDGCSWNMLTVDPPSTEGFEPEQGIVVEMAMEGLPADVCALFDRDESCPASRCAKSMTVSSGISALLGDATVDDWAFDPCGYSMNALRDGFYYTVHVTPEDAFSYASFETNDPQFADSKMFEDVLQCFRPAQATSPRHRRTASSGLSTTRGCTRCRCRTSPACRHWS